MGKYRILTEATVDLPQSIVEEYGIVVISMDCSMDGKIYMVDPTGKELDPAYFYEQMRQGSVATTSLINAFTFTEYFEEQFRAGYDVIYFALTSALTSRVAANNAMEELQGKYPERRLIVVDTLCASLGMGLLVYVAAKKQREGLDMDELVKWAEENKLKICHWFTVEDLKYLLRSGRVSAASAVLGTALNIKPVLRVGESGALLPFNKVQGRRRSLKNLVENMEQTFTPENNDCIFIGHADCIEDAEYVKNLVEERLGIRSFVINYIGPIIGAHSGPGTVALFHFGTHR
ncbi:MAG TPA: DegV family protein [Feifaniaceae bacterium]|nr:DegV family protein [Feifaniaceae bacterium]